MPPSSSSAVIARQVSTDVLPRAARQPPTIMTPRWPLFLLQLLLVLSALQAQPTVGSHWSTAADNPAASSTGRPSTFNDTGDTGHGSQLRRLLSLVEMNSVLQLETAERPRGLLLASSRRSAASQRRPHNAVMRSNDDARYERGRYDSGKCPDSFVSLLKCFELNFTSSAQRQPDERRLECTSLLCPRRLTTVACNRTEKSDFVCHFDFHRRWSPLREDGYEIICANATANGPVCVSLDSCVLLYKTQLSTHLIAGLVLLGGPLLLLGTGIAYVATHNRVKAYLHRRQRLQEQLRVSRIADVAGIDNFALEENGDIGILMKAIKPSPYNELADNNGSLDNHQSGRENGVASPLSTSAEQPRAIVSIQQKDTDLHSQRGASGENEELPTKAAECPLSLEDIPEAEENNVDFRL